MHAYIYSVDLLVGISWFTDFTYYSLDVNHQLRKRMNTDDDEDDVCCIDTKCLTCEVV